MTIVAGPPIRPETFMRAQSSIPRTGCAATRFAPAGYAGHRMVHGTDRPERLFRCAVTSLRKVKRPAFALRVPLDRANDHEVVGMSARETPLLADSFAVTSVTSSPPSIPPRSLSFARAVPRPAARRQSAGSSVTGSSSELRRCLNPLPSTPTRGDGAISMLPRQSLFQHAPLVQSAVESTEHASSLWTCSRWTS